jgi:2-keto-4-pentenoate hydratase/2-oxohepta-3-ene-1,7-dioic acid hydratase in catechol pathway
MKLATFVPRERPVEARIGVLLDGSMLDVADALRIAPARALDGVRSMRELLAAGTVAMEALRMLHASAVADPHRPRAALRAFETLHWLPPISDPDKFLCVGKNYRSHLEELKRTDLIKEMPGEPTAFVKLNSCLTGHDTDVVRPSTVTHLDYEPELVFVIGKEAFEAKGDDAFDYVAGITILNDLTCRDTQKREVASGSRFWTAKNAPGFGPLGPLHHHHGRGRRPVRHLGHLQRERRAADAGELLPSRSGSCPASSSTSRVLSHCSLATCFPQARRGASP